MGFSLPTFAWLKIAWRLKLRGTLNELRVRLRIAAAADGSSDYSNRYAPFTVSPFALTSAAVGGAMRFVYQNWLPENINIPCFAS
jgi:hypothetical protein